MKYCETRQIVRNPELIMNVEWTISGAKQSVIGLLVQGVSHRGTRRKLFLPWTPGDCNNKADEGSRILIAPAGGKKIGLGCAL